MTATQTPPLLTITSIEAAASAIQGRIDNTPILYSEALSEITGEQVGISQYLGGYLTESNYFVRRQII